MTVPLKMIQTSCIIKKNDITEITSSLTKPDPTGKWLLLFKPVSLGFSYLADTFTQSDLKLRQDTTEGLAHGVKFDSLTMLGF